MTFSSPSRGPFLNVKATCFRSQRQRFGTLFAFQGSGQAAPRQERFEKRGKHSGGGKNTNPFSALFSALEHALTCFEIVDPVAVVALDGKRKTIFQDTLRKQILGGKTLRSPRALSHEQPPAHPRRRRRVREHPFPAPAPRPRPHGLGGLGRLPRGDGRVRPRDGPRDDETGWLPVAPSSAAPGEDGGELDVVGVAAGEEGDLFGRRRVDSSSSSSSRTLTLPSRPASRSRSASRRPWRGRGRAAERKSSPPSLSLLLFLSRRRLCRRRCRRRPPLPHYKG